MEVNVLNLRKEIEDLKKVENLSSIITNRNPEIDYEVTTFLRSGHVYYLNTEISKNSNWGCSFYNSYGVSSISKFNMHSNWWSK